MVLFIEKGHFSWWLFNKKDEIAYIISKLIKSVSKDANNIWYFLVSRFCGNEFGMEK